MNEKPVLVAGATGYVGGRLVPRLLNAGYRVRALGRSVSKMKCRPWAAHPLAELMQADVLEPESMARVAQGCWAAFYLVHSMRARGKDYARTDRQAALSMVAAAEAAGLERLIYLGGIVPDDPRISKHLRSRAEVGQVLQSGPIPVTWLRAAMILGSGSASFELMRYLVDRLPVMTTPRWVRTRVQPIAIENVLGYLQGCLEHDEVLGQTFDIGGPEVVNYEQLFQTYAEEARLRRRVIIPVPLLTPRLSSYWIHLVTPVPATLARPLTEGLCNEVVVKDSRIREIVPQRLIGCREAIRRALDRIAQQRVETCWTDAGEVLPPEWLYCEDAPYAGGTVLQSGYRVRLRASQEEVWRSIARIGGLTGWYFGNSIWRLRGLLDELCGGVGLRRGRRHPEELRTGDALDFFRVLEVDPPRRLLLLVEMKLPGEAVLELLLEPVADYVCELRLIARFLPRGLSGIMYWYGLYPIHEWAFKGLFKGMARSLGKTVVSEPEPFDPCSTFAASVQDRAS